MLFQVIIFIMVISAIAFDARIYIFCLQQKSALESIRDKQDVEAEFNSNKFNFEEKQIQRLGRDLKDVRQNIQDQANALADQKNSLLQEVNKRQQSDDQNKNIQTLLVDIKAETDALKQDMKGWQKDYVSVLAQLEKKTDDTRLEIKSLEDDVNALKTAPVPESNPPAPVSDNSMSSPVPDNSIPAPVSPDPQKPVDNSQNDSSQ